MKNGLFQIKDYEVKMNIVSGEPHKRLILHGTITTDNTTTEATIDETTNGKIFVTTNRIGQEFINDENPIKDVLDLTNIHVINDGKWKIEI